MSSLDIISGPSTDIVIKSRRCSAVKRCRSLVHTLAIVENERSTLAVRRGQARKAELSFESVGKASPKSCVINDCIISLADFPERLIKNDEKTFYSLTAESTSKLNVVHNDLSELIVISPEAV